jgi:redox-sensing transcriptional repressor
LTDTVCAHSISVPAKERLLRLLQLMEKQAAVGNFRSLTSAQVEHITGWPRDTIRKDISCLSAAAGARANLGAAANGESGTSIGGCAGYEPEILMPLIKKALGLDRKRKFCVVGLGRLGSAYLNLTPPELAEFELAAGFDSNVNRVEILRSPAPLYPAYKMAEVISRFGIEIALLCVPAGAAQATAEKCAAAGVRGILNFAPVALSLPPGITVRNVYITDELRSLAIMLKNSAVSNGALI